MSYKFYKKGLLVFGVGLVVVLILVGGVLSGIFVFTPQDTEMYLANSSPVESTSLVVLDTQPEKTLFLKQADLLFVGDIMVDRTIRILAEKHPDRYDSIFSCVADYLQSFDSVIGNLEGPITGYDSVSATAKVGSPNNTRFTFSPEIVPALKKANIDFVSLGNNHILDFGREGARMSMENLNQGRVGHFGASHQTYSTTTSINGLNIGFVAFNQFDWNLRSADERKQRTVDEIKGLKPVVDFVILFAHWGDEYVGANDVQKAHAREFIDAGASLVIGAHPHVIQESEIYKNVSIYYSLGNFIFDQYWDSEVSTGLGLEVSLTKNIFGTPSIQIVEKKFHRERNQNVCLVE